MKNQQKSAFAEDAGCSLLMCEALNPDSAVET